MIGIIYFFYLLSLPPNFIVLFVVTTRLRWVTKRKARRAPRKRGAPRRSAGVLALSGAERTGTTEDVSNFNFLYTEAISNKCHASSNRCLTSSNKKLLVNFLYTVHVQRCSSTLGSSYFFAMNSCTGRYTAALHRSQPSLLASVFDAAPSDLVWHFHPIIVFFFHHLYNDNKPGPSKGVQWTTPHYL